MAESRQNNGRRRSDRDNNSRFDRIYEGYETTSGFVSRADLANLEQLKKSQRELNELHREQLRIYKQQKEAGNDVSVQKEKLKYLIQQRRELQRQVREAQQLADAFKTAQTNAQHAQMIQGMVSRANSQNSSSVSNMLLNSINTRQQQNADKIYNRVLQEITDKYASQGRNVYSSAMQQKIQAETYNEASKQINKAAGKYATASSVINAASNTFKTTINTLKNLLTKGLNKQSNVYENTFEGISVRTGITKNQYASTQWKTNNILSDRGLFDNIGTSEVQQMWSDMAKNGMKIDMSSEEKRAELTSKAIDNVLTNKIVPYLDTSSQANQLLNERLNGNFFKQIRGISQANMDIVGSNYASEQFLQTIIDELAPMSDKAIEDLAMSSTEMTSYMGMLISEYGLTPDQAKSQATTVFKQRDYGGQILSSGSTYERMAYTANLQAGNNFWNSRDWNNIAGVNASVGQTVVGWTPRT